MKIKCPKCRKGIRIGDKSRYCYFDCKCGWSFMGIEAEVDHLDFVVGQLIGYWCMAYSYPDYTSCPHCQWVVPLSPYPGGGYNGPIYCRTCHEKLPRRGETTSGYLKWESVAPTPVPPTPVYVPLPVAKPAPKPVAKTPVAPKPVDKDVMIDEHGRPYKLDSILRRYYDLDPKGIKVDEQGRRYKIDSIGRRYYTNLDD